MSSKSVQLTQKKPLLKEVQKPQPQLYNVQHNGNTRTVSSQSIVSKKDSIKLLVYGVGIVLVGFFIYFIWKKLSSFWLFRDIGSALGLANKAGRGTSNFFRGLF